MPQIVLKLSSDQLKNMKDYYQTQLKAVTPSNAYFAVKTTSCTITAYQSGKVLFQGQNPDVEANRWGGSNSITPKPSKKSKPAHSYLPKDDLFNSSHIGSDEAGTGDYFGPITVAAAYVTSEQIPKLKAIGVRDSKNLSDDQITELAKQIVAMKIPYSLLRLNNEKYNTWQRKGWSQGKMKTLLHHQALERLLEKISPVKPEGILVDQFAQPDVYQKHLRSENLSLQQNIHFMTKAESYSIAVAVGSIIARSAFVKAMKQLEFDTGLPVPKGASSKVDKAAAAIIKAYGESKLEELAKVHFANTSKAKKLI